MKKESKYRKENIVNTWHYIFYLSYKMIIKVAERQYFFVFSKIKQIE